MRDARLTSAAVLCACAGLGVGSPHLSAQVDAPKPYKVEHDVVLKTNGNLAPEVRHKYVVDTYARTDNAVDNPPKEEGFVVAPGGNTETQTAGPVPSKADATSSLTVNALGVGMVDASYEVHGSATAALGKRSAFAYSYAYSNVYAKGQKMDRKGKVKFTGRWKHGKPVSGKSSHSIRTDPLIARLIDNTTGEVKQWVLVETDFRMNYGDFSWEGDSLSSTAANLMFEINLPGDVTPQAGTVRVRVENGVVMESVASGFFAGSGVPPVGAPGAFSFSLPNSLDVDFDLGGDENHDLEVEFEADCAAMETDALNAFDNGSCVTHLGVAPDAALTSDPEFPLTMTGLQIIPGFQHVLDNFVVPSGAPLGLDVLQVPVILPPGAGGEGLQFMVNLYMVDPGTGKLFPIANSPGSVVQDVRETDIYRIPVGAPSSFRGLPVHEVTLDMGWAPLLPEGEIYIEMVALHLQSVQPVMLIPAVDRFDEDRDALYRFVQGNQFQPALDKQTGAPMDVSFVLFTNGPGAPCYADCDGDGSLGFFDFLCFQNAFAAGDPYADCDADGVLGFFDFLCFQNAFNAGCP